MAFLKQAGTQWRGPGTFTEHLLSAKTGLLSTKYTLSQLILPLTLGDKHNPEPSLQIRRGKLKGLRSRLRSNSFREAEARARWSDTQGSALNLFPFGLILMVLQSQGKSQSEAIACMQLSNNFNPIRGGSWEVVRITWYNSMKLLERTFEFFLWYWPGHLKHLHNRLCLLIIVSNWLAIDQATLVNQSNHPQRVLVV